ncbi:hypothetical protein [Richelia intracellularis]|jgi:uncharacterized membrane protein|uniref:hypothetical protein n=1 Tax=Richelia intracellularis TaxID=1164990 RepID=UPI0005C7CE8B|nr:hypothetical protein [Richelia intracellularis]
MTQVAPCITIKRITAKLKLRYELEEVAAENLKASGMEDDIFYNFFNKNKFVGGEDISNYGMTNEGLKKQE